MGQTELKVGLLGAGIVGGGLIETRRSQGDLIAKRSGTRLVLHHVAEPDSSKLAEFDLDGVKVSDDARAVIADPEVDAVALATPLFTHYPLAKAALEAGKHVLVEKPMAGSVAECNELEKLAAERGLTLMVDHTFLFTESRSPSDAARASPAFSR